MKSHSLTKVSIRELLGLLAIVALGISLVMARIEVTKLRETLALLSPEPHILLYTDNPVRLKYRSSSGIAVVGTFFPLSHVFESEPTVVGKLFDLETGKKLTETVDAVGSNPQGKGFGFNLKPKPGSVFFPGYYVVEVTVMDGEKELAKSYAVKHFVGPGFEYANPHEDGD